MGNQRFDVNNESGLDIDDVVIQFHLAPSLENVVHLGGFAVVVLGRIGDEGHVQVANVGVLVSQGACALAALAAHRWRLIKPAYKITFPGGRRHGKSSCTDAGSTTLAIVSTVSSGSEPAWAAPASIHGPVPDAALD